MPSDVHSSNGQSTLPHAGEGHEYPPVWDWWGYQSADGGVSRGVQTADVGHPRQDYTRNTCGILHDDVGGDLRREGENHQVAPRHASSGLMICRDSLKSNFLYL